MPLRTWGLMGLCPPVTYLLFWTFPTVSHQPGQAGGGWEELDSGRSSQNSLQENSDQSRTSESYSKSSSDNHLGVLEPGAVAERSERYVLTVVGDGMW